MNPNNEQSKDMFEILWIDDEVFLIEPYVAELTENKNVTIEFANDAAEAKKILSRKRFHAVVVDWLMPAPFETDRNFTMEDANSRAIEMVSLASENCDNVFVFSAMPKSAITEQFNDVELKSEIEIVSKMELRSLIHRILELVNCID